MDRATFRHENSQCHSLVLSDLTSRGSHTRCKAPIDVWPSRPRASSIFIAAPEAELIAAFQDAGFRDVHIAARFDCFAETSKERTARKYGVIGVNLSAHK
jgi:hypothetical protein